LFYLRSIAPPSIKSEDILWGSFPWVIIMLIMVALVILFPGMVALSIQIFGRF
jgi:TRAP-type mannitol/chloroaromatic compound transport system permease large subunit